MKDTAVVTIHRLPCLNQAARGLATNHREMFGLRLSLCFYKKMIQEQGLNTAQQELWNSAKEAMQEHCYDDALFLTQSLLRVLPEFLEARKMARQAAVNILQEKPPRFLERIMSRIRVFFLRLHVMVLIKKQKQRKALVVLEALLERVPTDLTANRWMASIAQEWHPPLLSLALFSLETAVEGFPYEGHKIFKTKKNRDHVSLHLDIARVALLSDGRGSSWNPERAITAYQQILSLAPNHLEARQGMKNASALLSMKFSG